MLVQVVTTCDQREPLEAISKELVELRLAACCQIDGPIESCYSWEGSVQVSDEYRCIIKTMGFLFSDVESLILSRHPYDQPQIYGISISNVEAGYLKWVQSNTLAERK